ncbi:MAG TPA: FKBP-type peptidyl-prolyl cis-trans isomerase [Candidatus Saccharimonadia bacterium]|nr:FKBP-type peptidyl-prolyl cis-trans isomerase [Candidatus Saccharimonadia bacterium]
MTRMRDRMFAGFGAFLFLASACGLTIFVIMQPGSDNTTSTASQHTCANSQTGPTLEVPEIYKPTGPVASLQTTDLTKSSGAAAKNGDCLVMKYYGTLASDGTKFDEDFTDTTAFGFTLGKGQVIEGWDKGLVGMKVGSIRRLVIPAAEGYGSQAQSGIPANSDLVFVVKLLRIQK